MVKEVRTPPPKKCPQGGQKHETRNPSPFPGYRQPPRAENLAEGRRGGRRCCRHRRLQLRLDLQALSVASPVGREQILLVVHDRPKTPQRCPATWGFVI